MESINLKEEFSKNLALRENARDLFKFLFENNIKTIDFKEVEYVSRSFANELLSLEKENKFNINKINMNDDVSIMFKYALEESPKRKLSSGFKVGNVDEILSVI
ncbi:hypothetical protein EOM09_03570 [bacterium]|nr:hypothetical protein [bacterium]